MARIDVQNLRRLPSSPNFAPMALLALCLLVFGDILTGIRHGVLSGSTTDLATEFYYWREFGFSNLRHGHLAQWNPYVCGGVPFFAGWQAGFFYPPNWIYLLLPLNAACNLDFMVSTYLAGLFSSMLARHHGLHPVAQLLCGAIVMLGGAFFPHIYAGHLATLAAMAWAPLVLLAVDALLDNPTIRMTLLAIFALSMELLAGHPQTLFNTVIMLAIYAGIRLVKSPRRALSVATFIVAGLGMAAITAVQLLPGLQVAGEGVRSHPVGYSYAGEISLQPISLLTLVTPHIFGDIFHVQYWGPWNQWEMCAFIGVASLPLVLMGALRGSCPRRRLWITMSLVLIVIAMGQYTPLFKLLYDHAPGFNRIRAYAKFMYPATIFLALLAASGLDLLLGAQPRRRLATMLACETALLAGISALACLWMLNPLTGIWLIRLMRLTSDAYYHVPRESFPQFAYEARHFAALGCATAALTAAAAAIALFRAARSKSGAYLLAAIALLELFCFARSTIATFRPGESDAKSVIAWIHSHPGDHRVFTTGLLTEEVMGAHGFDVWGYDPMVQRRYSEFVTRSQNQVPEEANMYMSYVLPNPALRLLRCCRVVSMNGDHYDYEFVPEGRRGHSRRSICIVPISYPMQHGVLFYRCRIMKASRALIDTVSSPTFPRTSIVVLERAPGIALRTPATPGFVNVAWKDSDTLEVNAQTSTPGIILITDAYSRFWRATALAGSAQRTYRVMPGDWALMAIPVMAGKHRFLIHYCPSAFPVGAWISALGLIGYIAVCAVLQRRR